MTDGVEPYIRLNSNSGFAFRGEALGIISNPRRRTLDGDNTMLILVQSSRLGCALLCIVLLWLRVVYNGERASLVD